MNDQRHFVVWYLDPCGIDLASDCSGLQFRPKTSPCSEPTKLLECSGCFGCSTTCFGCSQIDVWHLDPCGIDFPFDGSGLQFRSKSFPRSEPTKLLERFGCWQVVVWHLDPCGIDAPFVVSGIQFRPKSFPRSKPTKLQERFGCWRVPLPSAWLLVQLWHDAVRALDENYYCEKYCRQTW
jgi:hypothetical protein